MMKRPTVNSTEVSDEVASIFEDAMGFGDTQKHFEPPLQAGCTPTDPADLKRQIMSWNEWKNEREWWALHEIERLREALQSIAANTCCDKCQEAALVAKAALA